MKLRESILSTDDSLPHMSHTSATLEQVRRPRRVILAVVLTLTAGCADRPSGSEHNHPVTWSDGLFALISSGSLEPPLYDSAVEATPNTRFVVDGKPQPPVSDLLAVGRVVSVKAGHSFSWPDGPQIEGEPPTRVEHKFNSPDAWVSTVHIALSIDESVAAAGTFQGLSEVSFGLTLPSPADIEGLERDLREAHSVVAILERNARSAFDYDSALLGVLGYGMFLGTADPAGSVTFPASEFDRSADGAPMKIPLERLLAGSGTIYLRTDPSATESYGEVAVTEGDD